MNNQKPEIKELEKLVSEFDYLLQEGVIYNQEEIKRIIKLASDLQNMVDELEKQANLFAIKK